MKAKRFEAASGTPQAFAKIGYVLLNLQATERVVKRAVQIAMPREIYVFASMEEKLLAADFERPLGAFLHELRKRAELHTEVDALLTRFLESRNTFIHNISQPEGWCLQTEAGLAVVDRQLRTLLDDSKEVRALFLGLLHSWKIQVGLPTAEWEEQAFEAMAGKYEGRIMSRRWGNGA